MATSTTATTPALFRFSIHAPTTTTTISHTHPVPLFLCQPPLGADAPDQTSPALQSAFLDVLSVITAQHHAQCMSLLLPAPCPACAAPATDCLKSPSAFLTLAEPLVVISVFPVCGKNACEARVRNELLRRQAGQRQKEVEDERKMYGRMACGVCGREDAKRCAGCGTVGYCGRECQKAGWKAHRRDCRRGSKLEKERVTVGLPYETI